MSRGCRKNRAWVYGLLLTLLVPGAQVAGARGFGSKDQVPEWVKAAVAANAGKSYAPEAEAAVLLDETTLTVGTDGKAVEHRRKVVKILRPKGREDGIVQVAYDKDMKILAMRVWSMGPDGHEYAVKDSEMMDVGLPGEGGELYEDLKFRRAEPPGRDPGGVVAYEYDQRLAPYVHEDTWEFEGGLPRANQSFTLELPPGYSYGTVWAHHAEVKPRDLENGRTRWEIGDEAGIDLERVPLHPAMDALAGRMTVHYGPAGPGDAAMASWQGIGEWYAGLTADRMNATPEMTAKAAELTAGKTDFYEKAEAIGDYVQGKVRYFVVELGVGGLQPHPAGDIFKNGYGDCKDKATLLVTMLGTVGIHGALVMVDTDRGVVDPQAPSLEGDHMIAAIEIPPGYESAKLHSVVTLKDGRRYLIFDPTWYETAFGQLEENLQGSYGLLLEGAKTEIVELPVLSPELNTVRRTATFTLAADGTLKGNVEERLHGDVSEDWRQLYSYGNAQEQAAALDGMLGRDLTSFDVSGVKVENAGALNKDLTTTFELTAARYSRSAGTLLMVRPRVLGEDGMALDHKARTVPVELHGTRVERDDFTIEVPSGYAVDELPDPVKVDVGFAAYESSTEVKGTTLHYQRTYTVRAVSLPADKYGELQKLAGVIEGDEQNRAVLKKQ